MKHLPQQKSLFCLPLDYSYTRLPLGKYGAGVLKGSDRKKYEALGAVSSGSWNMLIAHIS